MDVICESGLRLWIRCWVTPAFRTQDQDLTGQIEQLTHAGCRTVYREKISGVRADRPELAKLMARLEPGQIVIVTKLDRLGRSTRELLNLIDQITNAGAAFRSLGDPLWDTSSSQGRLLSTMLAAIAEFERELIRERTGAGRERAKRDLFTFFGRARFCGKLLPSGVGCRPSEPWSAHVARGIQARL